MLRLILVSNRQEIVGRQMNAPARSEVDQREVVPLRDETVGAAAPTRPLPIRNTGAMNADGLRYDFRSAEFRDDGLCWLHGMRIVAIIATIAIGA